MNNFAKSFRELLRYPSAVIGLITIIFLLVVSVYALITIPYGEATRLWRGGEDVWYQNPKYAAPAWMNLFSRVKQPVSFAVNTADGSMTKTVEVGAQDTSTITVVYSFDYAYDEPPQEMLLYFDSTFKDKLPFASVALPWHLP